MAEYTPEEIVEMTEQLMKDIADTTKDIADSENVTDVMTTVNFVDRCTQIVKNLAESVAELHQRVDVLTEKE